MNLSSFLVEWNSEYPLDHWWRTKYNVPFNSPSHRSISYQDVLFDFMESSFFRRIRENFEKQSEESLKYVPGEKNFLKVRVDELKPEDFDKIDLDNFNFKT